MKFDIIDIIHVLGLVLLNILFFFIFYNIVYILLLPIW